MISEDFKSALRIALLTPAGKYKGPPPGVEIEAIVAIIGSHIRGYHIQRQADWDQYNPEFYKWMADLAKRASALDASLNDTRYAPGDPDHVAYPSYLGFTAQQWERLRASLKDLKSETEWWLTGGTGKPKPGGQTDGPRRDLEMRVADTLDEAGFNVTSAPGAIFEAVLEAVYPEAGVTVGPKENLTRSLRSACEKLPECRRVRAELAKIRNLATTPHGRG